MPRIVQSPKRGLNLLTIENYKGKPLDGHSIGGIVSTDYQSSSTPKQHSIYLEETGSVNTTRCLLRVIFYGPWRDVTVPRVKPMDRLYLSGPDIKVDPDPDEEGVICLRVSCPAHADIASEQIDEASRKGLAELGRVAGVAIQWDPLSPHAASSFALSRAAADDRVAHHAGPNKIFLPSRLIGAHEIAGLPPRDDREPESSAEPGVSSGVDAFQFSDGSEAITSGAGGSGGSAAAAPLAGVHGGAEAGSLPPIRLPPPIRVRGCKLLSELKVNERNACAWGVVVSWKPMTDCKGTDCVTQLTIIDDSSAGQAEDVPASSRVFSAGMKLFTLKGRHCDGIRPVSVGDIVYIKSSIVQQPRGIDLVGYKDSSGGTLLPANPAAAQTAGIPHIATHFGANGGDGRWKREGGDGPGAPLTAEERARVEQLRTWFQCISNEGYSLPNYAKRFVELRGRNLGPTGAYCDAMALVVAVNPVYQRACQEVAQLDDRVAQAGGISKVLGSIGTDPYRKELQDWLSDPKEVLRRRLAQSPAVQGNPHGDHMELYLWDGSDPDVVDLIWGDIADQGGSQSFAAWTGPPGKASGTLLRLTVKDHRAEVARLQLLPGDWVSIRNLRIWTDKYGNAGEDLKGDVVISDKNHSCGVLRLPVLAPVEAPLSLGPSGVQHDDVRQRVAEYARHKYAQYGDACGIAGIERWLADQHSVGAGRGLPSAGTSAAGSSSSAVTSGPSSGLQAQAAASMPVNTFSLAPGSVPGPVSAPVKYDWVTRVLDPHHPMVSVQQLKAAIRARAADVQAGRVKKGEFLGRWALEAKVVAIRPDNWLDLCMVDDSKPSRPWVYMFTMHVHCIKEAPAPRRFVDMKEDNLLQLCVGSTSAERILPGLPPCDLRANPARACAIANRLGVLGRPSTAMYAGVAVLFVPDHYKTTEPVSSGTGATQATQADWGQYVLDSCVFILVDTAMDPAKDGEDALEQGGKAVKWVHGPDCPCQAADKSQEELATPKKRSRTA